MDHLTACDRTAVAVEAFASTIAERASADGGLATAVPSCPGWTVAKLAKHLGLAHRWAAEIVRTRATDYVDMTSVELGWPDDPAEIAAWLRAGATEMVSTLRSAEPDTPVWAWGADQHVRFWSRRMLHESLMHTVDLQLSVGQPVSYPRDCALDAVDELLELIPSAVFFAPKVAELAGDGSSIHLHATDAASPEPAAAAAAAAGEWMIELSADGMRWHHAHSKGTVAVRATAGDLAAMMYGRLSPNDERFAVFGDQAVLDHWLQCTAL